LLTIKFTGAGTHGAQATFIAIDEIRKVNTMKRIMSAMAVALTAFALPAFAQSDKPNPSVPNANNSGAGISGYPGNKNGPAANKGTVGSSSVTNPENPAVSNQDAANVKGLPGNKSGPPPAKKPSDQR
jgi:hypothetical protein